MDQAIGFMSDKEIKEIVDELKKLNYNLGPIGPPSESTSLLLRVTENRPWSRCKFCYGTFYNREKFRIKNR